jgi:Fe-S cluster assembly ATPase SufC
LDITSKAISRANLIQPDSIFVIAKGDFDHNGKIDVAVQLAPEGYTIDTLSE